MENYQHVIHMALPDVKLFASDIKLFYREIEKGFRDVFSIINENNIESIALPLVYSGLFF